MSFPACAGALNLSSVPTLHPSIFIPPTPHLRQFSATVPSIGFLATVIGSSAGFRAVPQPSHSEVPFHGIAMLMKPGADIYIDDKALNISDV